MFLAGGPDGDFHVLTQSGEEFQEASDGEVTRAVVHQQGEQGGKCEGNSSGAEAHSRQALYVGAEAPTP